MADETYRRNLLRELHTLNQNINRLAKAVERSNDPRPLRIHQSLIEGYPDGDSSSDCPVSEEDGFNQENRQESAS